MNPENNFSNESRSLFVCSGRNKCHRVACDHYKPHEFESALFTTCTNQRCRRIDENVECVEYIQ